MCKRPRICCAARQAANCLGVSLLVAKVKDAPIVKCLDGPHQFLVGTQARRQANHPLVAAFADKPTRGGPGGCISLIGRHETDKRPPRKLVVSQFHGRCTINA